MTVEHRHRSATGGPIAGLTDEIASSRPPSTLSQHGSDVTRNNHERSTVTAETVTRPTHQIGID